MAQCHDDSDMTRCHTHSWAFSIEIWQVMGNAPAVALSAAAVNVASYSALGLLLIHAAEGVSRSRGTWQQAQPANNPHRSDTQITAEEGREIAKCVAVDWNDLCSASVHKSLGVAW